MPFSQLAERAVFQMKQHCSGESCVLAPVSSWQLEEAQVFWAKGEQEVALGLLRRMINNLEEMVSVLCREATDVGRCRPSSSSSSSLPWVSSLSRSGGL